MWFSNLVFGLDTLKNYQQEKPCEVPAPAVSSEPDKFKLQDNTLIILSGIALHILFFGLLVRENNFFQEASQEFSGGGLREVQPGFQD